MKDRHWLVYTHGGGRLGNQVLRWAHWLAWAMDHRDSAGVVNMAFWPYAGCFRGTAGNPGCVFPCNNQLADLLVHGREGLPEWLLKRLEWRAQRLTHGLGILPGAQRIEPGRNNQKDIDLDGTDFFEKVASRRVTMCSGWRISGWGRVRARQQELRAYFQPVNKQQQRAGRFIAEQRARFGRLVGVLIRQGDYMTWRGGCFGYSTKDYVTWMKQLVELEGGKGIGFVIASDTWQDATLFSGLPHVFSTGSVNAGGPAIASFAELAGCDVILAPPSTFAAMAAFSGECELWPLYERGQILSREQILHDALLDAAFHPIYSLAVQ